MAHINKNSLKKFLLYYIPVHILLYYIVIIFAPEHPGKYFIAGILSITGPLVSTVILFFTVRKKRSAEKVLWGLLFLGTVFYFLGELVWDIYFIKMEQIPLSPNLTNIIFSLKPLFYLAAFIFLVSHDLRKTRMAITIVDILIIVMVISSFSWYLLVGPFFTHLNATIPEITILLSYPLLELLILFGIFHARFFVKQAIVSKKSLNIFALSTVTMLISTCIYLFFLIYNLEDLLIYLNPLYTMGMFYISMATLYADNDQLPERMNSRKKDLTQSHFLPLVSIVLLIIIYGIYNRGIDELFIGLIFSFFLLFIRLFILLKENRQLNVLLTNAKQELEEKNKKLEKTIKELEKINEIRSIEARTDFLTGLYNRRYIDSLLHSLIKEANNEHKPFSILLIDIDHFKSVNDRYGHDVGDIVIQKAAQIFLSSVRTTDILGRFGGEEFIIILPNSYLQAGVQLAKRIHQKIEDYSILINEQCINITVSIGVTVWEINDQFNDIYRRGDEALYEAKKTRNTIIVKTKTITNDNEW